VHARPQLLPVCTAPCSSSSGGGGGSGAAAAAPGRVSGWNSVVGGLGGLAARFSEGAVQRGADDGACVGDFDGDFGSRGGKTWTASLEVHLSSSNRGFALMKKMGWGQGTGLGRKGDGRISPVRFSEQYAEIAVSIVSRRV
jgi:hypothetical protein